MVRKALCGLAYFWHDTTMSLPRLKKKRPLNGRIGEISAYGSRPEFTFR